ncbi:MAG: hypothetical protein ABI759_22110 [Candidatus Solibacter sp.]
MRVRSYLLSIPFLAGLALAQSAPVSPQTPAHQQQPADQQPADQRQPANPTVPSTPGTQDQKSSDPMKTGDQSRQSRDTMIGQGAKSKMEELKTKSYSGSLWDAACGGSGAASAASSASAGKPSSVETPAAGASNNSADRTGMAGNSGSQSCAISGTTSQFALKMNDGQVVRFDDVGNSRVQEAMKTHKKWSDTATAGKDVRVTVNGVVDGDKMTVMSIR